MSRTIHLTPSEEKLYRLLPVDGRRVTTDQLIRRYYGRRPRLPVGARSMIGTTLRSLSKKTARTKVLIPVKRSKRSGPRPIEAWLERR